MSFRDKILTRSALSSWRAAARAAGRKVVATNGCFDLLHMGHVTYLERARNQGDALLVGVTGDRSVSRLKGPNRPINTEADRAAVIAALGSVDAVFVFSEDNALQFLDLARPDLYAKGGDYVLDTINQEERKFLEHIGCEIVFIPLVPAKSTTALLEKISRL